MPKRQYNPTAYSWCIVTATRNSLWIIFFSFLIFILLFCFMIFGTNETCTEKHSRHAEKNQCTNLIRSFSCKWIYHNIVNTTTTTKKKKKKKQQHQLKCTNKSHRTWIKTNEHAEEERMCKTIHFMTMSCWTHWIFTVRRKCKWLQVRIDLEGHNIKPIPTLLFQSKQKKTTTNSFNGMLNKILNRAKGWTKKNNNSTKSTTKNRFNQFEDVYDSVHFFQALLKIISGQSVCLCTVQEILNVHLFGCIT